MLRSSQSARRLNSFFSLQLALLVVNSVTMGLGFTMATSASGILPVAEKLGLSKTGLTTQIVMGETIAFLCLVNGWKVLMRILVARQHLRYMDSRESRRTKC